MPDLISTPFYYCKSVENFRITIGNYIVTHGRSNGQFQYDWSCTCQGFKFRHKCKHIEEAKKHYCGWDEFIDGGEPVNKLCPKCNKEIDSRLVGV